MPTSRARPGEGSLVGPTLEQSGNILAQQWALGATGSKNHERIEKPAIIKGAAICRVRG